MSKREILKQSLKNWFSDKMEMQPTEENLNILVDRIYYNKQLILSGVSQQRELLKAYAELIQSSYTHHFFDDAVEESIDEFLSL